MKTTLFAVGLVVLSAALVYATIAESPRGNEPLVSGCDSQAWLDHAFCMPRGQLIECDIVWIEFPPCLKPSWR